MVLADASEISCLEVVPFVLQKLAGLNKDSVVFLLLTSYQRIRCTAARLLNGGGETMP
jgi:hypothetical protein